MMPYVKVVLLASAMAAISLGVIVCGIWMLAKVIHIGTCNKPSARLYL